MRKRIPPSFPAVRRDGRIFPGVASFPERVDGEEATLFLNGGEKVFRTTGRYSCRCMKNCGCGTISQKPGKCACGRILLPLEGD